MKTEKRFYKNKSVLIPGGAGFIGSNIAARLVELGARVTIVDPFYSHCGANLFNLVKIRKEIVFSKKPIEEFIKGKDLGGFDIIFNCIGLTDHHIGYSRPDLDYRINCASTLQLLRKLADEKAACRMISLGSRSQYGRADRRLLDEDSSMAPLDIQAAHKVTSEYYHALFRARYGLDLLYLRTTNVYGPAQRLRGDGIGTIGEMLRSAIRGEGVVVYGGLERVKDILFVADAVQAIISLGMLEKPSFGVYNLGGQPCRMGELINAIKASADINVKVIPFPGNAKKMDTGDVVLNVDRLESETRWAPATNINEGIGLTLEYYKKYERHYL